MTAMMEPLVDTLIEDPRWGSFGLEDLALGAVAAVLAELGLPADRYEISLLGCSDRRISDLNADFRGKPQPTNVLSWPSDDLGGAADGSAPARRRPGSADEPTELGDIAVAWETCENEAAEQGKTMRDHVSHLLVHGTLHLLGYDHVRDADAALMEGVEARILAGIGIENPYV
jgi:probable rRNA maturation factor